MLLGWEGGSEGREQELGLEEQQGHLEAACLPEHPLCACTAVGRVLSRYSASRKAAPGVPRGPAPGPGCLSGHPSGALL